MASPAEEVSPIANRTPFDPPAVSATLYELADAAPVAAEWEMERAMIESPAMRTDAARDDAEGRLGVAVAVYVPDGGVGHAA